MEGTGTHSGDEQEKKDQLEAFLRFGTPVSSNYEYLTPLSHLPFDYRKEIDRGYSTGFENLDRYLQGFRKGEITVVTADTGAGKTTFCTQLMINCAMQGIAVWINSWEMKPETTMRKLASIILRRPMKVCLFNDHENEQFDEWAQRYKVFVNKNTIGIDINTLASQLVEAKKFGIEIVMLDHLDYLVNTKKEKIHEAIDETIKRLHELAFALNMHFLLICHPRQSAAGNDEVGLHSLKGSSSIKQYADNVLILHRCSRSDPQSDPGKVKIRIAKNRMFGVEGNIYLFYEDKWDGYEELRRGS